jgi:type II secretory pathway pseudopilin PulG
MKHAGDSMRASRVSAADNRMSSRGFTYLALLVAIVIIGISMSATGKYWASVVARDKEEELLFRGGQYRAAIQRYYQAVPAAGRSQFPQNIDDLLRDDRTATGKRYLRQKYKDPLTGDDFIEIRDQTTRRIIGVKSASDKTPFKQADFGEENIEFQGKKKYSEWLFIYQPGDVGDTKRPTGMGRGG